MFKTAFVLYNPQSNWFRAAVNTVLYLVCVSYVYVPYAAMETFQKWSASASGCRNSWLVTGLFVLCSFLINELRFLFDVLTILIESFGLI